MISDVGIVTNTEEVTTEKGSVATERETTSSENTVKAWLLEMIADWEAVTIDEGTGPVNDEVAAFFDEIKSWDDESITKKGSTEEIEWSVKILDGEDKAATKEGATTIEEGSIILDEKEFILVEETVAVVKAKLEMEATEDKGKDWKTFDEETEAVGEDEPIVVSIWAENVEMLEVFLVSKAAESLWVTMAVSLLLDTVIVSLLLDEMIALEKRLVIKFVKWESNWLKLSEGTRDLLSEAWTLEISTKFWDLELRSDWVFEITDNFWELIAFEVDWNKVCMCLVVLAL